MMSSLFLMMMAAVCEQATQATRAHEVTDGTTRTDALCHLSVSTSSSFSVPSSRAHSSISKNNNATERSVHEGHDHNDDDRQQRHNLIVSRWSSCSKATTTKT